MSSVFSGNSSGTENLSDHDALDYDDDGALTNDFLSLYLLENRAVSLLTAAEEVELAKQIVVGHEAKQCLRQASGNKQDEKCLHQVVIQGEQARAHHVLGGW